MNPKISVVIPTYNRKKLLKQCLQSFSNQTLANDQFEVVVIDDGSSDGTRDLLQQERFPFALRFCSGAHAGAAAARNRGISEAKGEIVVFTDDDCYPDSRFLELHLANHEVQKDRVVRGPIVLIQSLAEMKHHEVGLRHRSANFFCTSNVSVRREHLLTAGMFDESFGRWEDAELGFRLRSLGLKLCFVPNLVVFHVKPLWQVGNLVKTAMADGCGARKLFEKHPSPRTWLSGGLHPLSLLTGKLLYPLAKNKVSGMNENEPVSGFWERIIFHSYFVKGLSKQ